MQRLIFLVSLFILEVCHAEDFILCTPNRLGNWTFHGKDTVIIKGKSVELNVEKAVYQNCDNIKFVSYKKQSSDYKIVIDSSVYANGSYSVDENNLITNIGRLRMIDGMTIFDVYDKSANLVDSYSVGWPKDYVYEKDGSLRSYIREVRGDTAFMILKKEKLLEDYEYEKLKKMKWTTR